MTLNTLFSVLITKEGDVIMCSWISFQRLLFWVLPTKLMLKVLICISACRAPTFALHAKKIEFFELLSSKYFLIY